MSKNLTRKGLAFGALLALGASVFAGVPANAAGESTAVTLSYAGTGTTVLEGADFGLTATLDSAHTFYNSSLQQYSSVYLAFVDIDGSDSANYQWVPVGTHYDLTPITSNQGNGCTDCYGDLDGTVTGSTGNQQAGFVGSNIYRDITDELRYKVTAKSAGFDVNYVTTYSNDYGYLSAVDNSFSTGYHQSGETARFEVEGISADKTAEIQSYVDLNDNGALDSNEPTGAAKTITWANYSAANATVTIDQPTVYGHQDIVSHVKFAAGYNATQMADNMEVRFFINSRWEATEDLNLDADGNGITSYFYCDIQPGYYWAQAMLNPWNVNPTNSGRYQVGATAITSVANPDARKTGVQIDQQSNANVNPANHIKTGTKSFDVTATVLDNAGNAVKTAGQKVQFTISESALDSTTTITAGGKTLKHSGAAIKVEALTDANGVAKVTIASDTGLKNDAINVAADTIISAASATYTTDWDKELFTWKATDVINSIVEDHNAVSWYNYDGLAISKPGSSYTLTYHIYDEWGTTPVGRFAINVYDYAGSSNGIDGGSGVVFGDQTVEFYSGKATVNVTEANGANRWYALYSDVYKWDATANVAGGFTSYLDLDLATRVETRDDVTPAGISSSVTSRGSSATNTVPVASKDFYDWNMAAHPNSAAVVDGAVDSGEPYVEENDQTSTIDALIVDKNGVPLPGVAVSATGAGLQFIVSGGTAYSNGFDVMDDDIMSKDKAVAYTDNYGYVHIEVASHKSGENVVTLTTGGVSTTQKFYVAYPSQVTSTSKLELSAPASVIPGAVANVSAKLTDKWGNAIKGEAATVSVSVSGVGYLTTTTGTVDSNGVLTTSLITSALQSGSAVITATTGSGTSAKTATATVAVAALEPAAIVNVVGHRVYVKFSNSRGEEVSAVIGGVRVTKTAAYDNYVLSRVIKKAGKYSVKAYVAGDLVKASTVTVK